MMIVKCGAGSGKSLVIKTVSQWFEKILRKDGFFLILQTHGLKKTRTEFMYRNESVNNQNMKTLEGNGWLDDKASETL